jgi:RNA polymerase sigma factor (TIGR02999 family)
MDETPITELLVRWREGAPDAEAALMNVVYPLLRELARSRLKRGSFQAITLDPTELVNEAYARLQIARETPWRDRVHFFAISAKIIRGLAVDYVRARLADKRGGDTVFVSFDLAAEQAGPHSDAGVDVLAIDAALAELEREDAVCARIVELKYFSGLTTAEIAEACGISSATVVRHWRFARAWLADKLGTS